MDEASAVEGSGFGTSSSFFSETGFELVDFSRITTLKLHNQNKFIQTNISSLLKFKILTGKRKLSSMASLGAVVEQETNS